MKIYRRRYFPILALGREEHFFFCRRLLRRPVPDRHVVAMVEKTGGQSRTHGTEANDRDLHVYLRNARQGVAMSTSFKSQIPCSQSQEPADGGLFLPCCRRGEIL